jgi:hypothetical protein
MWSQPDGLVADLPSDSSAAPRDGIHIFVGSGILDLDGSPLEAPVTAEFTTAPAGSSGGDARRSRGVQRQ